MSNKILEIAIREKIKVADGKLFQQLFWDIMILRYGDLQTPRMQQDLGNDGHTITGKAFFACYAPESLKYDNTETVTKIAGDFESFCTNWKDKYPFERWIFVTKDNLMGKPHQKIVELNAIADGVLKENWGLEQIVRETLCLDRSEVVRIFNLPDTYIGAAVTEEKDVGIVADIFDYIFSQKVPGTDVGTIKNSSGYTELTEKISLNFSSSELTTVREMIVRIWQHKSLVQKYLEDEEGRNPGRINALVDMIQADFRRIKVVDYHGVVIENVRVIEDLAREYLIKEKQSNPDYVACARAIVLYFFELCFLGKKTDSEDKNEAKIF